MTTLDAVVTGFLYTRKAANATSLNVTTGFSTVQSLTADDITVSIGATVTKDLNVGGDSQDCWWCINSRSWITSMVSHFNGNVDII